MGYQPKKKVLSDLGREDFQYYQGFLADPQPSQIWCGARAERSSSK
jgi:hypothetical protein